jgi:hypothetical protein
VPDKTDIEIVKKLLANLGKTWQRKPNGLKNTLIQLLLDRVTIWPEPETIRARLTWRNVWEQEILIRRPGNGPLHRWTEDELELLREHYEAVNQDELLAMLAGRSWKAKRHAATQRLGLSRGRGGSKGGPRYTPEEDELIRRYYAGEVTRQQVLATGRSMDSITNRARRLELKWIPRQLSWEPLENDRPVLEGGSAP